MHTVLTRNCTLFALVLALAACDKPVSEPTVAPEQATPPVTSPGEPAVVQKGLQGDNGLITATPGEATCSGTDVLFTWDAAASDGVADVEIWVGDAEGAVLFAAGGAQGSQATGPWVTPGTTFVMRDKADNDEIDRVTLGGDACPPAPAE